MWYLNFKLSIPLIIKKKMSRVVRNNLEGYQTKIAIWPLNYSSLTNKVLIQP
jgi:hypothetical protein